MPIPWCNDIVAGFCYTKKPKIDSACHELAIESGKKIMWEVNDQTCYCICSCLGEGTPITMGDGSKKAVQDVNVGNTVLATGLNLQFTPYPVQLVTHAAKGTTENTIYLSYRIGGQNTRLIVTMDQPMLIRRAAKLVLVEAKTLQLTDQLVDQNGQNVQIDRIDLGTYIGAFWELATSMNPPDSNFTGHLILTAGVITGDFAVTTFVDFPSALGAAGLTKDEGGHPIVGTKEWRAANPSYEPLAERMAVNDGEFTPAELHKVEIPAHASSFLPSWQAVLLELFAPKVSIDDSYYLQECEFLIDKVFSCAYPEIEFLFNWYSEDVNSHSWVQDGKQYVYLSGGLARIQGFEYDGVSLALAHEIGHLLGEPDMGHGVTCEGEADWYGAQIVLRNVWFAERYFPQMKEAIKQLEVLYGYLTLPEAQAKAEPTDVDKFGNRYPSNECRIETLTAAMHTPEKPLCAACLPQEAEA